MAAAIGAPNQADLRFELCELRFLIAPGSAK
jgi:hypothetical protein